MARTGSWKLSALAACFLASRLAWSQAPGDPAKGGSGKERADVLSDLGAEEEAPVGTEEKAASGSSKATPWEFILRPTLWVPEVTGKFTVDGIKPHLDVDLGDSFNQIDEGHFTPSGALEVRKGDFSLLAEFTSINYAGTDEEPSGDTDLEILHLVTELGASYRFWDWAFSWTQGPYFHFDVIALGRYAHVVADHDVEGPTPSAEESQEWLEPAVGARISAELVEDLDAFVKTDFGGFGIGSKFTWTLQFGIGWKVWPYIVIDAGYRVLDVYFIDGDGTDKFRYDATLYGPYLGFDFRF
jgi:hypothetical protein